MDDTFQELEVLVQQEALGQLVEQVRLVELEQLVELEAQEALVQQEELAALAVFMRLPLSYFF